MNNISHTQLLPSQSSWKEKFQAERDKIQNVFGDAAISIEHIGSTSIEGLSSKPIIDIAVMVENHEDADAFTEPLAQIGYRFHSSSTERHFYVKGDPIEYHLSIAYADRGGFWKRQILFRDYLRNHPEARDEYTRLKESLLKEDPSGSDGYVGGKSEFIQRILVLAEKEFSGK